MRTGRLVPPRFIHPDSAGLLACRTTALVGRAFALVLAALGRPPPFGRQLRPLVPPRPDAVFLFVLVAQFDQLADAAAALLARGDVLAVRAAPGPPRRRLVAAGRTAVGAVHVLARD